LAAAILAVTLLAVSVAAGAFSVRISLAKNVEELILRMPQFVAFLPDFSILIE
jgi:hypothetical protein